MSMTTPSSISPDTSPASIPSRFRIRSGLFITLAGLLVFLVGARPTIFGLDRSPVVGFIQIAVFLVGLGIDSISVSPDSFVNVKHHVAAAEARHGR